MLKEHFQLFFLPAQNLDLKTNEYKKVFFCLDGPVEGGTLSNVEEGSVGRSCFHSFMNSAECRAEGFKISCLHRVPRAHQQGHTPQASLSFFQDLKNCLYVGGRAGPC